MAKSTSEKDKRKKGRKKNKSKIVRKKPQPSKADKVTNENTSKKNRTQQADVSNSALSLASRLKKTRGTAATTPLPPEWNRVGSSSHSSTSSATNTNLIPKFLSPKDGDDFQNCVEECYRGFRYEEPDQLPPNIHSEFSFSFDAMNDSGLFLYDVVQPGGKRLSLTFVTRTLVGNPGSTYKYLGLRLFSHPWCDVDENGDGAVEGQFTNNSLQKCKNGQMGKSLKKLGYSAKCTKSLITMGLINHHLTERTNKILKDEISPMIKDGLVGSADYSLTLINRMEPSSVKKDLKKDNIHGMGKTSVSWHKDSGLQDFSSIAVYHTLQDLKSNSSLVDNNNDRDNSSPWKVALRVADAKSRTPALSVPLPSGTLYYLLDDFNHQHEHAVISGATKLRYSSTHRVARDGCGSWQYIRDKCNMILSSNLCTCVLSKEEQRNALKGYYCNSTKRKLLVKEFRACSQLMVELEFEWIRQWHIQGKHHADLHRFWHKPIQSMKDSYQSLGRVVSRVINILQESSRSKSDVACEDLFDVAIENAENVKKMRAAWTLRLQDPIFATLPDKMKPFPCSILDHSNELKPKEIRAWRGLFVGLKEGNGGIGEKQKSSKKRKLKDNKSNLTKKERKKIASNWEKMKGKI